MTDGCTLTVELEQLDDSSRWRGEFPAACAWLRASAKCEQHCSMTGKNMPNLVMLRAADLEDITLKTGSFKKFGVFVRMLFTALRRTSDSVTLDMLTYHDLERVKARLDENGSPVCSGLPPSRKRYLILTYMAEYDRVQYPLPLQFDDQPNADRLKVWIYGAASKHMPYLRQLVFAMCFPRHLLREQAIISELRRKVAELKDLGSGLAPDEWEALRRAAARHQIAASLDTSRQRTSRDEVEPKDDGTVRAKLQQVRGSYTNWQM